MTPRFAVIGNPIAHSKSPVIHAAFAAQLGLTIQYDRVLAPPGAFAATAEGLRAEGVVGANVTLPFKLDAFRYADTLSVAARQAEAANTLCFGKDGVAGHNTDGIGLLRDIQDNHAYPLRGKRVLVVGAGGAARGAIGPLLEAGPSYLAISNRTPEKAADIARHFASVGKVEALAAAALAGNAFDVVINATSASLGDPLPPVTADVFGKDALAYDMVYGKGVTPFLELARQSGARISDGLGMLIEQAAEGFWLWHGVRPQTAPVLAAMRTGLPDA